MIPGIVPTTGGCVRGPFFTNTSTAASSVCRSIRKLCCGILPVALGLLLIAASTANADAIGSFYVPSGTLNEGQNFRDILVDSPYTDSVFLVDPSGIVTALNATVNFGGSGIYTWSWSGTWTIADNLGSLTGTVSSGNNYYYTDGTYTWTLNGTTTTTTGTYSYSDSRTITVNNVAPTITAMLLNGVNGDITINEGTSVTALMQSVDPGYWDYQTFQVQNTTTAVTTNLGTDFTLTTGTRTRSGSLGVYTQQGGASTIYNLIGRVFDDDTNTTIGRSITVNNLAPLLTFITPNSLMTSTGIFSFSAGANDPGFDPLSFAWDLDNDGFYDDFTGASGSAFFGTGLHLISVRVSDGDGGLAYGNFTLTTTPEPSSLALLACGGIGLVANRVRVLRRSKQA